MKQNKGDEFISIDGKFQSKYFNDTEKVFNELNKVSPSFCLAKWYNVSIHIPTGQTHSCYHPRSHHIPLEEVKIDVSALHNTRYKKQQRKLMLEGKRPSECEFCWQIEDSGNQLSDRAYRSADIYKEGIIEQALADGHENNSSPRYVEVNFNQSCNFKCSYCSPHLSTAWQQEIEKFGSYQLYDRKHNDIAWVKSLNIDNSNSNPYLEAFWKWFPSIYNNLHTFRMTGGEPLMDRNTFKIFDYVKTNPKKDLHLGITSNCCPPGDQWNKFMKDLKSMADNECFDHFMLYCSLDSWGEQAEYIRNGMDFEMLYKNVTDYLANGDRHSLTFIITFNVLSYSKFKTYIENILKLRREFNSTRQLIWFDIPQLSSPDFLNPKLIPDLICHLEDAKNFMLDNKETSQTHFKGFKDFEISKIQRLIDWIKADDNYNRSLGMKNFYMFVKEHDSRRNTDFHKTFPELENFWKQCEEESNG
jgi:hypothetical protein